MPLQYMSPAGVILSPWDVIVAAKGYQMDQRHSIWVTEFASGLAVAGARVELLQQPDSSSQSGQQLARAYRAGVVLGAARTDNEGFAEIVPSGEAVAHRYPWAVRVTLDDTVVVLPIASFGLRHRRFQRRFDNRRSTLRSWMPYALDGAPITWGVTDKPLYRQGETVRIKGYVRLRDDNRLVLPSRKESWTLSCRFQSTDACAGQTVNLDDYGAFDVAIELPNGIVDGDYQISAAPERVGASGFSFRVANYRPKPHRVQLEMPAARLVGEAPLRVQASAEYFAGGVVRDAAAQVFIETRSDALPVPDPILNQYTFGDGNRYDRIRATATVDASTDGDGRLLGDYTLPQDSPVRGTATVTVGVRHEGGSWAYSDPVSVEYIQTPIVLGLRDEHERLQAGAGYRADVLLIDLDGTQTGEFVVTQRLEYPVDRYSERTPAPPEIVDECTIPVRAGVPAGCELTPTRIGRVVLRAQLRRNGDVVQEVERSVNVAKTSSESSRRQASEHLDVSVQGGPFKVTDTAEIAIDLPYDEAVVLFTARRNNVFDHWRETLREGERIVRLPLTEMHAPGFTLTAIASPAGGGLPAIGTAEVIVQSGEIAPTLTVSTDRDRYKAGETVRVRMRSSANDRTQLAVAVINEAVLDLVADADGLFDPEGDRFVGSLDRWGDIQWWQLSMAMDSEDWSIASIQAETALYNLFGAGDANAMQLSALSAPAQDAVAGSSFPLRALFRDSAYFDPAILTSIDGDAEVTFDVPDNLGTWRVVVVGADLDGRVFAGTHTFDVAIPVEVRAELPARLISGDTVQATASALSRKETPSDVTLTIDVQSGSVRERASRSENVGNMETLAVSADIVAQQEGQLELRAVATDGNDRDGLQIDIPVVGPVEQRSWTTVAALSSSARAEQPVELPANAVPETATLRVTVDRSVVGDLSAMFRYMRGVDHRSWETLLSRAVVSAYAEEWGEDRTPAAQLTNLLLQGSNFQSASGGMNHFKPRDDIANDYLSAYTLLALSWIEQQGFAIPAYRARLAQYLRQRVDSAGRSTNYSRTDGPSDRDMPAMLAALTLSPLRNSRLDAQTVQYLSARADSYDAGELAFALLAATNLDNSTELQRRLVERLSTRLVETFDGTEIADGNYRFGNRSELYCVVLAALQKADVLAPDAQTLAQLVRGGYSFRDPETGFGNTHGNALCVVALTEFRDAYERATQGDVVVGVDATESEEFAVLLAAAEESETSDSVALPLANRRGNVSLSLGAGETAFASTNIQYSVDLSQETERSHGYTLRRTYSVFRGDGWREVTTDDAVVQGDWVRIQLEVVTPVVRRFAAIVDPTPAGLEPVDESLVTVIPNDPDGKFARWSAFDRRALSNEESRFYAEWLSPGSHSVTYYARARYSGDFAALPAKVESMYSDGVFATTGAARLRVTQTSGRRE